MNIIKTKEKQEFYPHDQVNVTQMQLGPGSDEIWKISDIFA